MNNLHLCFAFHLSSFFLDIFGQLLDSIFSFCHRHFFASSASMEVNAMEAHNGEEIHNCLIELVNLSFPTFCCLFHYCFQCSINTNYVDIALQRSNPKRRRDKVYIGCGAGFGGDRPLAALKLLQRVKELNYLVLECLAERTLAEHYQIMLSGGDGYDSQSRCLIFKLIHFSF